MNKKKTKQPKSWNCTLSVCHFVSPQWLYYICIWKWLLIIRCHNVDTVRFAYFGCIRAFPHKQTFRFTPIDIEVYGKQPLLLTFFIFSKPKALKKTVFGKCFILLFLKALLCYNVVCNTYAPHLSKWIRIKLFENLSHRHKMCYSWKSS